MGAHHSREKSNGEKGRRRKYNTSVKSATSTTAATSDHNTTISSANVKLKQPTPSPIPPPQPHISIKEPVTGVDIHKAPRYSPFYKRTTSTTNQVTLPCNPVKPVRHQVVLSDQVVPLSSLVSISRHYGETTVRKANKTLVINEAAAVVATTIKPVESSAFIDRKATNTTIPIVLSLE
ncbi:unnamed protein product [Absidia cylindrospora]